jgi:restriction endonuclease S subunit
MGFEYERLASDSFELPRGWKIITVSEVASVNELSVQNGYVHHSIEYIDIASVDRGVLNDIQIHSLEDAPSRARRIVRDNDILISSVRPNLEHYLFIKKSKPNLIASTGFVVVSAKKVNPRFLYFYLISKPFIEYLSRIADSHTSAYPSFNPDVIEKAELLLPPPETQHEIAGILGALDDKIELNRRMNETLEAIARAIFKSWFVDFDPVRAKSEGRDTGLPPDISALFPSSFVDSELGKIPKGWKVGSLGDTVEILSGGTPKTSIPDYWDGDVPWFTVKDTPKQEDVFVIDTERHITQAGVDGSATEILPVGTTIISARGTVGSLALVGTPMAMNQSCYGLCGKDDKEGYYTYFSTVSLISDLKQQTHGSVFDTITRETFKTIWTVLPLSIIVTEYNRLIKPAMELILNHLREIDSLTAIRDSLLPELMSGNIAILNEV